MYVYCVYAWCLGGQKRACDSLKRSYGCLFVAMWVLGAEPRSFSRAVSALNPTSHPSRPEPRHLISINEQEPSSSKQYLLTFLKWLGGTGGD